MSWVPNSSSLSRLALAALLVTTAAAAAADVLVVRSSGPSAKNYRPGQRLADNARITLRSGDTVVLLDSRGTRTFTWPRTITASSAVQAGTRTVQGTDGRRARIGAVRSAGIVPASPTTIWDVDVTQSGTMCLASTSGVRLWRPESSQPATLTISGPGGTTHTVPWPAGSTTAAWPSALPISDGAEYRLSLTGSPVPTTIRVKTLPAPPADLPAVAQALIANDCPEQLDLLVATAPTF
jgi:hypothetical protein